MAAESGNNSSNRGALKLFAPVIAHDVTLPNTTKKVPMVMVPVPDSRTLMAIPISTFGHFKDSQNDEQQAKDLLTWNDGIGTLNGCDLRFRINKLGCLELIDSDDESEKQNLVTRHKIESKVHKKPRLEPEAAPMKQISPGSSLLRDGPDNRRPKTVHTPNQNPNNSVASQTNLSTKDRVARPQKIEKNIGLSLLEKLVAKFSDSKTNVEEWTTEDVRDFVDNIPGCSGCGKLFESQQICGKSLMYLDQRDLLDVINVKLGPAVKIYNAISLLK